MHDDDLPPDQHTYDPAVSTGKTEPKKPKKTDWKPMRSTPATTMLGEAGLPYALHTLIPDDGGSLSDSGSSLSGTEKAKNLGIDSRRVFKTMIVSMGPDLLSATIPVSTTIELQSLAAATGGRSAILADPGVAMRASGYETPYTSPLGLVEDLPAIVDTTAMAFPSILIESGVAGLMIELTPGDLVNVLGARTAPIATR